MSTEYWPLKEPVRHLAVTRSSMDQERMNELRVFLGDDDRDSGILFLSDDDLPKIVRMFADRTEPVAHTHWGGPSRGAVVFVSKDIPDDAQVISEYGELFTVADVKARDGAKRKDGMPTELFGYEQPGKE